MDERSDTRGGAESVRRMLAQAIWRLDRRPSSPCSVNFSALGSCTDVGGGDADSYCKGATHHQKSDLEENAANSGTNTP
jgi:hypothetical protein